MTISTSLERLAEHIGRCHTSLSNVGAEGIFHLHTHLRLAIEWSYNLELDVKRVELPLSEQARYLAIAKSVQALDSALVTEIPNQIVAIYHAIAELPVTVTLR